MKTVLELTPQKALKFFMDAENYCSLSLPVYFNFQPVLNYVQEMVVKDDLDSYLKTAKVYPSNFDGVNYKMLINKDGRYAFRPLQIANPFLYYLLVRNITTETNWDTIKSRFRDFKDEHIEVSSIPGLKGKEDKTLVGATISNWWENVEQRTIELSIQYKYMFATDTTNCYSSIYTHAIGWAIEGKDVAKAKRGKASSLGNTIDTYIREMQYGQTNGIPQGSALFDFIAEIILGYADKMLTDELQKENISKYKIIRYRDDYRVFSNSKEEIEKIALVLQNALADLNFQMNASKTRLSENIVEDAIKPDKLYYITNIPAYRKLNSLFASFQKELYYILLIAKRYPNSGTISRLLNNIGIRIEKRKSIKENILVLVAILVEIAILSPKVHQLVLACISNLISRIETNEEKRAAIEQVRAKLNSLPNIGHTQIWLQRITYKLDREAGVCPYQEPLCRLMWEEKVNLWNLDWLRDDLKEKLPILDVCDTEKRDSMVPFIEVNEISIFDY